MATINGSYKCNGYLATFEAARAGDLWRLTIRARNVRIDAETLSPDPFIEISKLIGRGLDQSRTAIPADAPRYEGMTTKRIPQPRKIATHAERLVDAELERRRIAEAAQAAREQEAADADETPALPKRPGRPRKEELTEGPTDAQEL